METRNDLEYANSQPNENELNKESVWLKDDVKKAIKLLRDNGYYVDGLYHIEDVQNHYECEDEIAQEILGMSIDNDGTANQIWESIVYIAENEYNLTPKE